MPIRRGFLTPTHDNVIQCIINKFENHPGRNFIIGNAQVIGCPIIYCNRSFCELYGYDRSEIVQKSCCCDFLYGPDTSPSSALLIKQALQDRKERHIELMLYRKDGAKFRCFVVVVPLRDKENRIIMYLLNHQDVGTLSTQKRKGNPLKHRMKAKRKRGHSLPSGQNGKGANENDHGPGSRQTSVCDTIQESDVPLMTLTSPTSSSCESVGHSSKAQMTDRLLDVKTNSRKTSFSLGDVSSSENYSMNNESGAALRCTRKSSSAAQSHIRGASSDGDLSKQNDLETNRLKIDHSTLNGKDTNWNSFTGLNSSISGNMHHHKGQKVAQMMSLGPDVLPEYKVECPKIHPFTILHYSPFKAIWDWVILFLVMYTAIVTPYMAVFVLTRDMGTTTSKGATAIYDDPLVIIDYIVDVMFIIDIFINFRTTFVDGNDEVVSDPCRIAVHYIRGWLIIDLLAAIPFELLIMIGNTDQTTTLIGLLKTARLLRLVRVARKVDRYSEYGAALLLLLMFGFALIAHWLACIWYAIGNIERPHLKMNGWLHNLAVQTRMPYNNSVPNSGPDLKTKYLAALYYTLSSLTSVGFGNIAANTNSEKVFTIIVMLGGSLMYAVIFGNVTAIIQRLYSGMAQYHSTMRRVREFIRFYQVPTPLRRRLEDYAQYDYSFTNGIDMNEVLRNFPEGLQAEVCLHLNRHLLSSNAAFKSASPGCLRTLSLKLKTTHCPPGNYIIHSGDEITNLYWIGRGTVEIIQNDTIMAILGKGDTFGENFGLVLHRPTGKAKSSVRALTYCDLHAISRDDLLYILKAYPNFRKSFCGDLQVTYDLRDPELERMDRTNSMFNIPHMAYAPQAGGLVFFSPERANGRRSNSTAVDLTNTSTRPKRNEIHLEEEDDEYCETTNEELSEPLIRSRIEEDYDDRPVPTHCRPRDVEESTNSDSCCQCSSELKEEIAVLRSEIGRMETSLRDDVSAILALLRSDVKRNGNTPST